MTLVDSNVLLDVVTDGEAWADWSQDQLERTALSGPLVINGLGAVRDNRGRRRDAR